MEHADQILPPDFLDQAMLEISLCVFDLILGPRPLALLPWSNTKNKNKFIEEFFDFHAPGDFFTHIFSEYLSFNYLFEIEDKQNIRGGTRLMMLTASVPFDLLKRKNLLQYYTSMEMLFIDWVEDLEHLPHLCEIITDGAYEGEQRIQPLLYKLCNYLGELQFIIKMMPETLAVPITQITT